MVRKSFLGAVVILMMATHVNAKKEKTITRQDTLVTDAKYGFSLVVNENWKVRDFKEPSVERVFLEKKNYSINREIQSFGGDYTIPTVLVYAQPFNGTIDDFEALIKKSLDEHFSDNEIVRKLGLLRDSDYIIANQVFIDSLPARQIFLKRNYKRLLSEDSFSRESSPEKQAEKFINDHEVHELYLAKVGGNLVVLQAYCEREFYAKENKAEFGALINSIHFQEPVREAAPEK